MSSKAPAATFRSCRTTPAPTPGYRSPCSPRREAGGQAASRASRRSRTWADSPSATVGRGPALFIASPTDPLTGRSVPYSLEPFLPTLAYGGGGVGFPSDTPLTFTAPEPATLSITLSTPSRANQRLLASAASRPYFTARGALGFPTEPGFSGPNRHVGLTASDPVDDLNDPSWPATVVEFEETGLHRVSVSGELITLWGTTLEIDGTFEIWVAEPLDVNLGTFEGTPLAVGDSWSPVVHIEPGVPAAVVVDITHYPNGDAGAAETFHGEGMANAFGYFTSNETWAPTSHGEYTVSVTASYTDPADGTLWMGTRSGASIVATPNTPLIAHGQRDVNIGEQTGDLFARTWYIARSLIGDASTFAPVGAAYPFGSGVVNVGGSAGALPEITDQANELTHVLVMSPQWDRLACTTRGADGSFDVDIEAVPSATIFVAGTIGCPTGPIEGAKWASAILHVPLPAGLRDDPGFVTSGRVPSTAHPIDGRRPVRCRPAVSRSSSTSPTGRRPETFGRARSPCWPSTDSSTRQGRMPARSI